MPCLEIGKKAVRDTRWKIKKHGNYVSNVNVEITYTANGEISSKAQLFNSSQQNKRRLFWSSESTLEQKQIKLLIVTYRKINFNRLHEFYDLQPAKDPTKKQY